MLMERRTGHWGSNSTRSLYSDSADSDFDDSEDKSDSSTTAESEEKQEVIDHHSLEEREAERAVQRRSRCREDEKWKRLWGLIGYLVLTLVMYGIAFLPSKSDTDNAVEQSFSILALLIVLVTYSILYYTESNCGKGLDLWTDPILCRTIEDTRGMWIANVGFGIAFSFSIEVQAVSNSGHEEVSLHLWVSMALAMGFVIYFTMGKDGIAHGISVSFFALLLVANLIVEVVIAPDSGGFWHSGGWFQVALCMIIMSVLIPLVEEIIRSIYGARSCNGGGFRNQLYIHFSLLFYLVGIVVRSFS